jgi:hypothetical protein
MTSVKPCFCAPRQRVAPTATGTLYRLQGQRGDPLAAFGLKEERSSAEK